MCILFYGGSGQHLAKTLLEKMVHIPRHFSFLTPSTNFFANCWSSAAGIFSMFLSSSSLLRNSLNNFRSDSFLLRIGIFLVFGKRRNLLFSKLHKSFARHFHSGECLAAVCKTPTNFGGKLPKLRHR